MQVWIIPNLLSLTLSSLQVVDRMMTGQQDAVWKTAGDKVRKHAHSNS